MLNRGVKAFVLAAGGGTRLRPLTDTLPKPMISVDGRPLLEHTIESLARAGVRDIVINLHHAGDVIREHFGDGSRWGVRIQYSPEAALLGTAGALRAWRSFLDSTFLVVYGDNLSTCDVSQLITFHRRVAADATVALFWRDDVTQSGIADVAEDGRVLRFVEKPAAGEAFSHWVNAGLLVLEPHTLSTIPADGAPDFGRELLPRWVAEGRKVFGYRMSAAERLWWIDTMADFERVQQEFGST